MSKYSSTFKSCIAAFSKMGKESVKAFKNHEQATKALWAMGLRSYCAKPEHDSDLARIACQTPFTYWDIEVLSNHIKKENILPFIWYSSARGKDPVSMLGTLQALIVDVDEFIEKVMK